MCKVLFVWQLETLQGFWKIVCTFCVFLGKLFDSLDISWPHFGCSIQKFVAIKRMGYVKEEPFSIQVFNFFGFVKWIFLRVFISFFACSILPSFSQTFATKLNNFVSDSNKVAKSSQEDETRSCFCSVVNWGMLSMKRSIESGIHWQMWKHTEKIMRKLKSLWSIAVWCLLPYTVSFWAMFQVENGQFIHGWTRSVALTWDWSVFIRKFTSVLGRRKNAIETSI